MKYVFLLCTCHTKWQYENRQRAGDIYMDSFLENYGTQIAK
jgi:hypothetical protein